MWRSEDNSQTSVLSPHYVRGGLGDTSRLSALAAGTITHWAILPALVCYLFLSFLPGMELSALNMLHKHSDSQTNPPATTDTLSLSSYFFSDALTDAGDLQILLSPCWKSYRESENEKVNTRRKRQREEKQSINSARILIPLLSTVLISTGLGPAGCWQHQTRVHFHLTERPPS